MMEPSINPERLAGKVVLVTGAAGGQGREAVRLMAAHGATVIGTDVVADLSPETRALFDEAQAAYVALDMTDEQGVVSLVDGIVAEHGKLDVLYCNHAITQEVIPLVETSSDMFDRLVSINLRSAFLVNKFAARAMLAGGGGSIVNVASVGALVANPGIAAYSATKAALVQMSKVFAVELADSNVRVNVICPGLIDTPMAYSPTEGLPPEEREQAYQNMRDLAPMRRIGRPDEVVWAGIFLASDEASFTTGAVISVDGGVAVR